MKITLLLTFLCFLTFPLFIQAQSMPIQEGMTPSNNNLYHNKSIGLNTSNPNAYLHIVQKDGELLNTLFKIEGTQANISDPGYFHIPYFDVNSNGNVGIGTSSPSQKLHVNGGSMRIQNSSYYLDIGAFSSYDPYIVFKTNAQFIRFDKQLTLRDRLVIENSSSTGEGNVQLALNSDGTIRAREVKVDLGVIPDYVFSSSYDLMTISDLRAYIKTYHHLPNIKSEEEFKEYGSYPLGEMNLKLLEKIEELTLYIIELEERIQKLEHDE